MKKQLTSLLTLFLIVCNLAFAGSYQVPPEESVTFYHTDHLGSPAIATDHNGNLIWEATYAAYGQSEKTYASGHGPSTDPTGPKDNIGFSGHEDVEYTGLIYMKARWYHPKLGRFLQPDPVGFVQSNNFSVNRFTYTNNNPVHHTDPDGEWLETAWDIASFSAGVTSAIFNFKAGNIREGLIDTAFAVVDGIAVALPGVPGGAGILIQAGREGGEQIIKNSDEIVTIGGKSWTPVTPKEGEGVIYIVPGEFTQSGKPYVGRANDLPTRARNANDGRDRNHAIPVDTYPIGDINASRAAEQRTMNAYGLENLDNMRNEIAQHKWTQFDIYE